MSSSFFSLTRRLFAVSLGAAALQPFLVLAADTWPNRPVRFIVPFPPGGPVDTTARIFSQKLADLWKVPTVIDNRAGAGGIVGATAAAKEAPDGYALFVGSIHHAVNPSLMGKLPYDIEKDFAPVSFAAVLTMVVVAHPSVPANNITELIALAKKEKGRLAYGSSGNGGGTHLAGELFDIHAGTRLLHVPYKGSAPAMNGLLGGEVQLMFSDASTALPFIKAGKIKALAVTNSKRSPLLPNVPTVAESGLPGYEAYSWVALFAPARTPQAVLDKLNADFNTAMNDAEVRRHMLAAGIEAEPGTPAQLRERLHGEILKWQKVIQTAGITVG